MACNDFIELPSYLLELFDNREFHCSCQQCDMDLYKGETAWEDAEDTEICFCSHECAVEFFNENMIVKKVIKS